MYFLINPLSNEKQKNKIHFFKKFFSLMYYYCLFFSLIGLNRMTQLFAKDKFNE